MLDNYNPKVTVILPLYRENKYLLLAIKSILKQTYSNFELIILCDNPSENTYVFLEKCLKSDARISVFYEKGLGLVNSLNKGLSLARGIYIARMDADDISNPNRLQKQVEYMDQNPNVCVCGTWIKVFGATLGGIYKYPTSNSEIQCQNLFSCSIAHPSVIIRKKHLVQKNLLYDNNFKYCEDYDFWVRISEFYPLANIGKPLLYYRIHPFSIGNKFSHAQTECADKVRYRQLRDYLGLKPTVTELKLHGDISNGFIKPNIETLNSINLWLIKIKKANDEHNYYNPLILCNELAKKWYISCYNMAHLGLTIWKMYQESPFSKVKIITNKHKKILLSKCLLKIPLRHFKPQLPFS